MQLKSIQSEVLKILFDTGKDRLLIGDVLKITDSKGNGVIAQIFEIEGSQGGSSVTARVLFTVEQHKRWVDWKGNVPSLEDEIVKIDSYELSQYTGASDPEYAVTLGQSSLNPKIEVSIEASKLESQTAIFCDNQGQRTNISQILATELAKNGAKTVLLDFKGEYSSISEAAHIAAGADFKLPLNSKGIEWLYEKGLSEATPETKAVIEEIFAEVQDYADSSEIGFIPFASFKAVVEDEYNESNLQELVLLKNQLSKFEKQGIFANKRQEISAIPNNLRKNNLVIIDFSNILPAWHKEFVEYIINSNFEKFKQPFFLLLEATESNIDDRLISKLFIQGMKSGIRPIVSMDYEAKFAKSFLAVTVNLILHSPRVPSDKFPSFGRYLDRLNPSEVLIYGEISNYVPLFVKVSQVTSKQEEENRIFESPQPEEARIPETYPTIEKPNKQDIQMEEQPNKPEVPLKFSVPEESPTDIEDVSVEQIDEFLEDNSEDDSIFDDLSKDDSAEVLEYKEEDDFDYDVLQDDFDEFQDYEETPEVKISERGISPDTTKEIQEDIDSLFRSSKSEPSEESYEDFLVDETDEELVEIPISDIPIYSAQDGKEDIQEFDFKEGDRVRHQKYGTGVINKIIGYGNKKLCSIQFEEVGRRLLDPGIAALEKL